MILYHGSNTDIKDIDLSLSRPFKDFGRGFYLSDNEEQALKMAQTRVIGFGGEPKISKFEFDETILTDNKEVNVKLFKEYSSEWAQFVFDNREGRISVPLYDIVYGPIANDRVGLQIRKLRDGSIDTDEFLHRLKYMEGITFQYFFGSLKAVKLLTKIE